MCLKADRTAEMAHELDRLTGPVVVSDVFFLPMLTPERFFDRALEREAAALNRAWPKRRRQILDGYPKFTRADGPRLVAAAATPEELEKLEWRPGSEADFCSAFYWELAEIPHERILAFDREKREIGAAPALFPTPLDPAEIAARRRVLEGRM